jgi:KUP system potassium uptake protein
MSPAPTRIFSERNGGPRLTGKRAKLPKIPPLRAAQASGLGLLPRQLLWDRYGVLPRNLIFVAVIHRKVPYIHENRYAVVVFDRDQHKGSIISVELSFGFMEEPNVERALEGMARHREIDLPTDRRQWIVHVSNENVLPATGMSLFRRIRFRVFMFLRLVSRPAYYAYGLGDAVQLSAEVVPVRVK